MRYSFAVAALVGLASASPAPQLFDPNVVQGAPSPTATSPPLTAVSDTNTVNSASQSSSISAAVTSVATGVAKRNYASSTGTATTSSTSSCPTTPEAGTYCGFINPEDPCAKQPDGYGPMVTPDTVEAFEAYEEWGTDARKAKCPSGYAQTFEGKSASVSANSYLGLVTLHSYDPLGCSQLCDNTPLCTGFNIYVERDPSLNPADACPMPSSISNYKCTLWGSGVEPAACNNFGGYRGQFHVVIAGSDGYEKTNNTVPATPPGCKKPVMCPSGAVNNEGSAMGTKFFPGPYDVNACADYAKSTNEYNKKHGEGKKNPQCKSFNSYMIKRDGVAQGTYCALFSKKVDAENGKYQPGHIGDHYWGIESSCVTELGSEDGSDGSDGSNSSD